MPDEEFGDMVELGDAEISSKRRLTAFFSNNPNADVGGLDHGDVIAAIPDAGDAFLGVLADKKCYLCFLSGRASTGYHCGKKDCKGDEWGLESGGEQV